MIAAAVLSAQLLFDKGLRTFYAYDRAGAAAYFQQALAADPHDAFAAWGEALALGPDLNHPMTRDRFTAAQAAIKEAVALESFARPRDRALIDALALRFGGSWDAHADDERRYLSAMDRVAAEWPLDDDVAMVDAEALQEGGDTAKALQLVQTVVARNPNHLMANHLCIHIYDAMTDHRPALGCADRLNAMSFAPNEEHLAHMPAHTYTELGMYAAAVAASDRAWQLREAWNRTSAPPYQLEYAAHDAEVGYAAELMLGNEATAQLWGSRFGDAIGSSLHLTTLARFGRWQDIIAFSNEPDLHKTFALGLAYAHTGNVDGAKKQLATLAQNVDLTDYASILQAAIDEAQGRIDGAIGDLRRAVRFQRLAYSPEELPMFPATVELQALLARTKHTTL